MIEKDAAAAKSYIGSIKVHGGNDLVLLEDKTIERPFGWVFFYDSKKYLETGDYRDIVLGNAPIIVDRRDGSVYATVAGRPLDYHVAEYEKKRGGGGSAGTT